jgi:hypothetical protein
METNNFLATYLSSSIVAFDYFAVPDSAVQFGEHTFRLLYAIINLEHGVMQFL